MVRHQDGSVDGWMDKWIDVHLCTFTYYYRLLQAHITT
jgi:hypothetical protein